MAFFLSLLGFSAIQSSCAKYGTPCNTVKPQITGSVVSDDNVPIQGIRAVLKDDYQGYDTAYTARNGGFLVQCPHDICKEDAEAMNFRIELQDVNDNENCLFENMEIPIAAKSEQSLGTVKMTPK